MTLGYTNGIIIIIIIHHRLKTHLFTVPYHDVPPMYLHNDARHFGCSNHFSYLSFPYQTIFH